MGNSEDSFTTRFLTKYNFIEMVNDPAFGMVKIYRKKEINFDYVMTLDKFVAQDNVQFFNKKIECLHASFFKQKQPDILTIYHYSIQRQNLIQCGGSIFRMYVQYLNYSFHNFLQQNAQKNQLVSHNQILYLLRKIIDNYEFFSNNNLGGFALDLDKIFLTTQGWVKISPFKSDDFVEIENDSCIGRCQTSVVKRSINLEQSIGQFCRELKRLLSNIIDLMICTSQKLPLKNIQNNILKVRNIKQLKELIKQPTIQFINIERRLVINDMSDTQITNDKNKSRKIQKQQQQIPQHLTKKFRRKL